MGLSKGGLNGVKKVVLLLDNHSSHISSAFRILAEEYGIILVYFIPHTTHFMQPLDVKAFNPYKHWHSKAIRQAMADGEASYNIVSFMWDLPSIRREALTPSTIKSVFKVTGLWPPSEEKALAQLKVFEPTKPDAWVLNQAMTSNPESPKTLEDTINGLQVISTLVKERRVQLSSSPTRKITRILSRSEVTLKTTHLDLQGFEQLKTGIKHQQKRKSEWTGGRMSGHIPVFNAGEALKSKNEKIVKARKDKAEKREKALQVRDNVIKRYFKTLEVKRSKLEKAKGLGEGISKAESELATAQQVYNHSVQQKEDLVERYATEDKAESERLEALAADPVLKYSHPDYGAVEEEFLSQFREGGKSGDKEGENGGVNDAGTGYFTDLLGDNPVATQQDFIQFPAGLDDEVEFYMG